MAKVIAVGQPVNDSERQAIGYLRDHLPSAYTLLHNFEIVQDKEVFEIDLAILSPHAVYIVDIKGTLGRIDVYGNQWYPEGRSPFFSPLAKLREHAKIVKDLICESHSHRPELRNIHVQAAVLLTAANAQLVDTTGRDEPDVVYLNKSLLYFQDKTRVPDRRSHDIASLLHLIQSALQGKSRPAVSPRTYQHWQVEEKLGETKDHIDYRARNIFASKLGKQNPTVRLRVYHADPYLPDEASRQSQMREISNAYRTLSQLPPHANILAMRDFFISENGDECVLVTDDFPGEALKKYLERSDLARTFDQKLRILRDTLAGLGHAHQYQVVHRNLTPNAILVGVDGQAKLTAFDYARVGENRDSTIAEQIIDKVDPLYQAPECYRELAQASPKSDLFSAGLIFYRLLTGVAAFHSIEQLFDQSAVFPSKPSALKSDLPVGFDAWLQKLCAFDPLDRFPNAIAAAQELEIFLSDVKPGLGYRVTASESVQPPKFPDLKDLPQGYNLGGRFIVQERLGEPGAFGVAYKVFDTYGDVNRVLKMILRNRSGTTLARLRQEYKALSNLPEHPNIVKVIWADRFTELKDTPYVVFEYLEGHSVDEFIKAQALSLGDARSIAEQAATGLAHIHKNNVYHQDIKPSNLLWTNRGVRIIDFNVAVSDLDDGPGGGTRRYMPADFDPAGMPTVEDRIDRDLFALAITFYECVTGQYPFNTKIPEIDSHPKDAHEWTGFHDLSPAWVNLFKKALSPRRAERFHSADDLLAALKALPDPRPKLVLPIELGVSSAIPELISNLPNHNPFVDYLLTLYSQSQRTNSGTRGLDALGSAVYVETLLDTHLRPAVLNGDFRLVIITGNAGDGKTAFIQQLENYVQSLGAQIERGINGSIFTWQERTYCSNYDGSQDEGDKENLSVLLEFLNQYEGDSASLWPAGETRLIAINEGRLVDFINANLGRFSLLANIIQKGLKGEQSQDGVAVINLNLRSVVADPDNSNNAIFDRIIQRFIAPEFWESCDQCDLRDRCYVRHNIRTLGDPVAGPKVVERLKMLYTATHLRGRLHITLRDLRSALAYTLVGTRGCEDIHALYLNGQDAVSEILAGFYFNSWHGGTKGSADRLLCLLKEIDIGETSVPDLDRQFDFLGPGSLELARFEFADRGGYDDRIFKKLFDDLERAGLEANLKGYFQDHRQYVAMLRRRHYFERRDENWQSMLPYRQINRFLKMVQNPTDTHSELDDLLAAINRGEGLSDPNMIRHKLALRVRVVERGTVRSYRIFDGEAFQLSTPPKTDAPKFLEYMPQGIELCYLSSVGHSAELLINLDIYEMLARLNDGYRPSIEEQQGFYRTLAVFKNVLASAPYQEVLITETGHEFYRMSRENEGILSFGRIREGELKDGYQAA